MPSDIANAFVLFAVVPIILPTGISIHSGVGPPITQAAENTVLSA